MPSQAPLGPCQALSRRDNQGELPEGGGVVGTGGLLLSSIQETRESQLPRPGHWVAPGACASGGHGSLDMPSCGGSGLTADPRRRCWRESGFSKQGRESEEDTLPGR